MSFNPRQLLFAAACLFAAAASIAQQFPIRNYGMNDGLSHSNVYRVYQDRHGFLWFCTNYGLCSFDGKNFRAIENDSLLNGSVLSMSEDEAGNKLISTIKEGVILMSDSFIKKFPDSQVPKYALYAVSRQKRLWVITREAGKCLYRVSNHRALSYNFDSSFPADLTLLKIVEYGNEVLFTSNHGLYRLRDTVVEPFLQDLIKDKIRDVKKSIDSTYWICSDHEITGIKNQRIVYSLRMDSSQMISNILCDRHHNVWISLYNSGILLLHNGGLEDITKKLAIHKTLVNDLFEDSEGNIWIATYDAGVYKISTLDIVNYSPHEDYATMYCNSIAPIDKNRILISTIGRLFVWENNKVSLLATDFLKPDEFIYFAKMHEGLLYIGTPKGLYKMDLKARSTRVLEPMRSNTGGAGALFMYADSKNNAWIGNYNSLFRIKNNMLVVDSSETAIKNRRFNTMIEDHRHHLWFGTSNGLVTFDGKRYREVPVAANKNFRVIHAVLEDSHHRIWAATEGGLLCFEGDTFKIFTTKSGLTHNKCNQLAEDRHNTLWVGTLHGLSYVDLNTLDIKGYGLGIYPDEALSLYFKDDNTLFVGTATGLSSIKTNRIRIDESPPPVYITTVKTSSRVINMPQKVSLSYYRNKLVIDFIGLSFQNANTVEYRYKIENLNQDWIVTDHNSIELSSLPPGNYNFILSARKNKGRWSNNVKLFIAVSTPFWKSWWFIASLLVFITGIIFFITWWQTKKHELKKREKLSVRNKELSLHYKVAHLKQQALRALINPHFIFNCMNSIQHYLNRHDNDKANSYLADFAFLIRMTMENAQDAFIGLDSEIARIKLYLSLEQLRFGNDLHYEIRLADDLAPSTIRIPNMLLQPYIENAIWHGIMPKHAKGNIIITIKKHLAQELKIEIEDDGIGIMESKKNKSKVNNQHFGMVITSERLALLRELSKQNYQVKVTELLDAGKKPAGTLVEIILPVSPVETDLVQPE